MEHLLFNFHNNSMEIDLTNIDKDILSPHTHGPTILYTLHHNEGTS